MRRESLKYRDRQDMTREAKQGGEGHGEERGRKLRPPPSRVSAF